MSRLTKYLIITFSITWSCWLTEAALTNFWALDLVQYPRVLFVIGGFGPTIAAALCGEGPFSLRGAMRFLFGPPGRVPWVFGLLMLLEILVFALSSDGWAPVLRQQAVPEILTAFFIWLQATLLFGGNEEPGWRGRMQPELEKRFSTPVASLLVGVVWVVWHLPLWLIRGDSHQQTSFLTFAALGLLLSLWLGALKKRTGSVFFCMMLHGMTNTLLGTLVIRCNLPLIVGLAVLTAVSLWLSGRRQEKKEPQNGAS